MLNLRKISPAAKSIRLPARFYSTENVGPQPTEPHNNFNRREKASEDWYIRQHERETLKKLQTEINEREAELNELKDKAKKLSK
ncbi:ATPase-binding protein [Starmerella bacillaris]|uniref:ATPase inhibitor, mitochondrial n=1 Tax=Starmerella bacillaris TaxID=1247836 RepID=A0AAV5RMT6_STABA|nr:ATPase-binding protein [Starmerella bacillaris]